MCQFFSSFFIENNLNYLVGGNITLMAISATAGGNITFVALSDTFFSVVISSTLIIIIILEALK